jgi:hypothetical protein
VLAALLLGFQGCPSPGTLRFSDVTLEAGLDYSHGYTGPTPEHAVVAGGAAAGDFDGDGYVDLYVVRGTLGPNLLFRNQGDGTFQEVGESAGVAVAGSHGSGPLFADLDGDGRLDLFVGAVEGDPIHVFRNRGDGGFDDVTLASGIDPPGPTISAAAADVDRDGDLDLFLTHWNWELPAGPTGHLWQNDGGGVFHDVSVEAGITAALPVPTPFVPDNPLDLSFTPNFVDVDDDGWPDLLLTSDFRTSQLLRNRGDGSFEDATPDVVSDENGMGAAIGDYDGDLDLDWFVTSIYDPDIPPDVNWGGSGNRLYRNEGQGVFSDVTDAAGVREGFWGWGTCFADFDNDADLDLFHVNGWPGDARFAQDPSRLFLSNGDGTFTERSAELGLVDTGDGRGVVCFDYDRDGDLDIFVANNGHLRGQQPPAAHPVSQRPASRPPIADASPAGARGKPAGHRRADLPHQRRVRIPWGARARATPPRPGPCHPRGEQLCLPGPRRGPLRAGPRRPREPDRCALAGRSRIEPSPAGSANDPRPSFDGGAPLGHAWRVMRQPALALVACLEAP